MSRTVGCLIGSPKSNIGVCVSCKCIGLLSRYTSPVAFMLLICVLTGVKTTTLET
jgi:hypothetical protein